MAIAELCGLRRFSVRDYQIGPPGPGEVQVRVEAVGICGSDLHQFSEGHVGDIQAVYPMVPGHEPVGSVLAAGAGVSGWSAGDRVAMEPAIYCYHCGYCMAGQHNHCGSVRFMSSPTEPGYFRDRVNVPAANLLPLPPNLGWVEGTLFEPLGIILQSFRFAQPKVGETAVVIGAGPIGLTTIAALRLAGVSRLWAVEPVAHRREMALALGATAAVDPGAADPVAEVLADTRRQGADMVLDCATRDDTINQAIRMAAHCGRVIITGVPSETRIPIEFHPLRRKELHFTAVRRSNHTDARALEMLSAFPARFTPMITHRRPLAEVQSSFETLEAYRDGVGKIVLLPEA
jgi:L-iditol 2-dehydrogenase